MWWWESTEAVRRIVGNELIDWDPNTSRSRASRLGKPVSRWSITITLVVFVVVVATAWFILSRDDQPRKLEVLDVANLELRSLLEEDRNGIRVFRGDNPRNGYGIVATILYSDELDGSQILASAPYQAESSWLRSRDEVTLQTILRNAVVLCIPATDCGMVGDRLENFTR